MKKLIAMIAIAAFFSACSNSTNSEEDIARKKADSIHAADSVKALQDAAMQMDRDKMMKDSLDKIKKDSLDKLQKK